MPRNTPNSSTYVVVIALCVRTKKQQQQKTKKKETPWIYITRHENTHNQPKKPKAQKTNKQQTNPNSGHVPLSHQKAYQRPTKDSLEIENKNKTKQSK